MDVLQTLTGFILDELVALFEQRRIQVHNERSMQRQVWAILYAIDKTAWVREHNFDARNRVDFWNAAAGIGIECKVKGSYAEVLSQVMRYSCFDEVRGILLVTKRSAHLALPDTARGKPLRVHWAAGNVL